MQLWSLVGTSASEPHTSVFYCCRMSFNTIAAGRMWSVTFSYNLMLWQQARVSFNDDSYKRKLGMTAGACAPIV